MSDGFECELCGRVYRSKGWYTKHIATHETSSVGADCGDTEATAAVAQTSIPCSNISILETPSVTPSNVPSADADNETDVDEEAEVHAERLAASKLQWEDWSGTDDDEETETYCQLITEPWRDEEEEERRRLAAAGEVNVDPPAEKPTKAPPVLVKCNLCSSTFKTLEGYINHRISHGMQAALLKMPSFDDILKECPRLAKGVLKEIQEIKLTAGHASKVISLAREVDEMCESQVMVGFYRNVCESLYSMPKSSYTLPSAFAAAFLKHSASVIVDVHLRYKLMDALSIFSESSPVVRNVFLASFLQKFCQRYLACILHFIRTGVHSEFVALEKRYTVTNQSTQSLEYRQIMHYIAGSNVKSVLKSALLVKHRNEEWHRRMSTICNHFLISEFAEAPEAEQMAWTEDRSRGKLTKVSAKALEFFVQLGKEVKPLERLDGSLINDEVIDKISKSASLLLRWDELKGNLMEAEAFKLLHALTLQFCITYRNAIKGRREDEMAMHKVGEKFGTGGLSFRAKKVSS